ncbi:hypothetical protein ACS0TY_018923 [Phlomoides rotata]
MAITEERARKSTLGRRKIEIKKIENLSSRQVTFSKRRLGLFKKASELCILSGAEIAIIVKSHSNRVFSFGHPTADAVIDRFLGGGERRCPTAVAPITMDYNKHYSDVCRELDAEKRRREVIAACGGGGGGYWWEEGVEGKNVEELEQFAAALDELRKNVTLKADETSISNTLAPAVVQHRHLEAPPPAFAVGYSYEAAMPFVNQDFHNQHAEWFNNFMSSDKGFLN